MWSEQAGVSPSIHAGQHVPKKLGWKLEMLISLAWAEDEAVSVPVDIPTPTYDHKLKHDQKNEITDTSFLCRAAAPWAAALSLGENNRQPEIVTVTPWV